MGNEIKKIIKNHFKDPPQKILKLNSGVNSNVYKFSINNVEYVIRYNTQAISRYNIEKFVLDKASKLNINTAKTIYTGSVLYSLKTINYSIQYFIPGHALSNIEKVQLILLII